MARSEKQQAASRANRVKARAKAAAASMSAPITSGAHDISLTPGNMAAMAGSVAFTYKGLPAIQRLASTMMSAGKVGVEAAKTPGFASKAIGFGLKRALPIGLAYGISKGLYTGGKAGGVPGAIRGALMGAADAVDPSSWAGHGIIARGIGAAWDATASGGLSGLAHNLAEQASTAYETVKNSVGYTGRPNDFNAANERYEAMKQATSTGVMGGGIQGPQQNSGQHHTWDDKARAAAAAARIGAK